MKTYILIMFIVLQSSVTFAQMSLYSSEYKILNLIVNNIGRYKADKVFEKYATNEKKNIYYNVKNIAINYITLRQKFGIDTNQKYNTELRELPPVDNFNIYCIKDTATVHIAKGDLIISIFQPNYMNGYFYVMAFARNHQSHYGDHITNFLFILNGRMKVVKFYYIRGII